MMCLCIHEVFTESLLLDEWGQLSSISYLVNIKGKYLIRVQMQKVHAQQTFSSSSILTISSAVVVAISTSSRALPAAPIQLSIRV